jgi:thymidylate synthase
MSAIDEAYKQVIRQVRSFGELRPNRTGVNTIAIPSAMFQYEMSQGFPVLHNKKVSFKTSAVETSGFLQGITDKSWYQERGCTIWNEWCNPYIIPRNLETKEEREAYMLTEMDLGPIYGAQWRNFNDARSAGGREDQIATLLENLASNPDSRRMIVSAWNPLDLPFQALPPCHYAWQVLVINGRLHLSWNQRSVDVFLGLPYNICMYGLLLELLAAEFDYEPGMLTGFLGDTHIYQNHQQQVDQYLERPDAEECAPILDIKDSFKSIDTFEANQVRLIGYKPHPAIKADVAV